MFNSLMRIVEENKGKRIAIISHATAIMFLVMKIGDYRDNKLYFNNKVLIDENFKWDALEVFKIEFDDDNQILNINNIK